MESNTYKLWYLQKLLNVVVAISDTLETAQTVMLFSYIASLGRKSY